MAEPASDAPHWAWPHVIAVVVLVAAYALIYMLTGDSDLYIAVAMGALSWIAAWAWLFTPLFRRKK